MHAGGLIRSAHVAAAGLVVLGAIVATRRPALARRYEWIFWAAALVLVVTGLGNLATLGGAAGGAWRSRFGWKLALVAILLLGSGLRLVLVLGDAPPRLARLAYASTATLAALIVSLGLVIAHA